MSLIVTLVGLLALVVMLAALARTIATDGHGTRQPRSHPEEVGSWIDQQLLR